MTFDDLIDLRAHIQNYVGYNVIIGDEDVSANSYPCIKILLDGNFRITEFNTRAVTLDDDIKLKVIVSKDNELEAFRIRDKLVEQLGIFKSEKGTMFIPDEGTREYTDNVFEITVVYQIKNVIQNIT